MEDQQERQKLHHLLSTYKKHPSPQGRQQIVDYIEQSSITRVALSYLIEENSDMARLQQLLNQLEEKVTLLTAPPRHQAVLIGVHNGTAPARAVVALNAERTEVAIDGELDHTQLRPGTLVLLNNARNCVIGGYNTPPSGGELATLEQVLDARRLVLNQRDDRMVLESAFPDDAPGLKPGDQIRFDRNAGLAYEVVAQRDEATDVLLERVPTTTFSQIGGLEREISQIQERMEMPLLHRDTCKRFGLSIPRGMVIHGPPGCGKTRIAQAIANRLSRLFPGQDSLNFISVQGGEILSKWVGQTEGQIRKIFRLARAQAACTGGLVFIFWDELDAIGHSRGALRGAQVDSTLIPTLLSEIQGFETDSSPGHVLLCAATNRPDLLDAALMRPGRLGDLILEIPRPNRTAARQIFRCYLTPDHPVHPQAEPTETLIENALAQLYGPGDDQRIARIVFRDGERQPLFRRDLINGALIEKVVTDASRRACLREIDLGQPDGLKGEDLTVAIDQAYSNLAGVLKPHNLHDYITLPQDRDVVAIDPNPQLAGVHTPFVQS